MMSEINMYRAQSMMDDIDSFTGSNPPGTHNTLFNTSYRHVSMAS